VKFVAPVANTNPTFAAVAPDYAEVWFIKNTDNQTFEDLIKAATTSITATPYLSFTQTEAKIGVDQVSAKQF
jgi:hypothetical protein